jgi:hypothetical protein
VPDAGSPGAGAGASTGRKPTWRDHATYVVVGTAACAAASIWLFARGFPLRASATALFAILLPTMKVLPRRAGAPSWAWGLVGVVLVAALALWLVSYVEVYG